MTPDQTDETLFIKVAVFWLDNTHSDDNTWPSTVSVSAFDRWALNNVTINVPNDGKQLDLIYLSSSTRSEFIEIETIPSQCQLKTNVYRFVSSPEVDSSLQENIGYRVTIRFLVIVHCV